ncbi:MAG: class I SAM-dependent methyltransferase [Planctomycetes bacterium]|nr:class I SAM-dependent methyltransferase [Planctomycetota bacterium]
MLKALLHRIVARPWVYNKMRTFCGVRQLLHRLRPLLAGTDGQTVLDVGAGTGLAASMLPPTAWYVWLDNDPAKLGGFNPHHRESLAMLGSATQIGLREKSVDVALCVNMCHHLSDRQVGQLIDELGRVVRDRVILSDIIPWPSSLVSLLLWRYDRGAHPRSWQTLRAALSRRFRIEHMEIYTTYHHYIFCVARPRD